MCNAWNHSSDCTCGFGGEGHLGRSPGGFTTHTIGRFTWQRRDQDVCWPTTCPRCGEPVFFVRHNGGSVWFDELGPPWPKHGCFDEAWDEGRYGIELRRMLASPDRVFGLIIETETTRPGEGGRFTVRCCDGSLTNWKIDTSENLRLLLGSLVVIIRGEEGELLLRFVEPQERRWRLIAYWQIIENESSRVVKEFDYWRKAEAEQLELELQAQHPGRYRLEYHKRHEYR